jgi:hypothetical protein
MYVWLRWARLTTRTYGMVYLMLRSRPRHAGVGRALPGTMWGRAHGASTGYNVRVPDLVRRLARERGYVYG